MNKLLLITGALLVCFSLASHAHSGGGNTGLSGGASSGHTSSESLKNTNGPNSADRDTGLNRAGDRMSKEGLSHEKATKHTRRKGKDKHRKQRHDADDGTVK